MQMSSANGEGFLTGTMALKSHAQRLKAFTARKIDDGGETSIQTKSTFHSNLGGDAEDVASLHA
jgi:hypothetical protein